MADPGKKPDPTDDLVKSVQRMERKKASRERALSDDVARLGTRVRSTMGGPPFCRCGKILIHDMRKLEHTLRRLKEEEEILQKKKQEVVDAIMKRTRALKDEDESRNKAREKNGMPNRQD